MTRGVRLNTGSQRVPVTRRRTSDVRSGCPTPEGVRSRSTHSGRSEREWVAPPIVRSALRSPGQPLDSRTRAFMEPRLGIDLHRVRIHTGELAAASSRAISAAAYTVGHDIVFAAGRYAPATGGGRRLLAHELAHVALAPGSASGPLAIGPVDDTIERHANATAERVAGAAATVAPGAIGPVQAGARVRRQPEFSLECNEFQRCNVIEPLAYARAMVDAVVAELGPVAGGIVAAGRIIDLLHVHFHTSSAADAATILDKFRLLRAELDARVRYVCHEDNPSECEATPTGFVGGFTTCAPAAEVHLCSLFHVGLTCQEQARVLVHEAAHHIPGVCADHAYVGDSRYPALPASEAMGNADTFAQFAAMVYRGSAACTDCGHEIQRSGRRRRY